MPGGLLNLSVHIDTKKLVRDLSALADKQIPFATATALNGLGAIVVAEEKANLKRVFPTATPFTLGSVVMLKANKNSQTVTILMKDRTARYLTPYENGGRHVLNSKALLNPKNVALNQYGNLPRNMMARLKGLPGVFVGEVQTKHGPVSGVWQRPTPVPVAAKGQKRVRLPRGANVTGKLKLLIRFGDALPVKERLNWAPLARAVVAFNYAPQFNKAMACALATAR